MINIKIKKKQLKENKKELKQYSQELYNDFEKNEINNNWDFKAKIKQENKNPAMITNSPFKSLNNLEPSTSNPKANITKNIKIVV